MPRIEPYDLAPLVGFATWHLEHGASVEETVERLRRHEAYCQFGDDALRKVVRRALSDLKHWQKIRHCCGWTATLGPCSFDEADQESKR